MFTQNLFHHRDNPELNINIDTKNKIIDALNYSEKYFTNKNYTYMQKIIIIHESLLR